MQEQTVTYDTLITHDAKCVSLIIRSDSPIPMQIYESILSDYLEALRAHRSEKDEVVGPNVFPIRGK